MGRLLLTLSLGAFRKRISDSGARAPVVADRLLILSNAGGCLDISVFVPPTLFFIPFDKPLLLLPLLLCVTYNTHLTDTHKHSPAHLLQFLVFCFSLLHSLFRTCSDFASSASATPLRVIFSIRERLLSKYTPFLPSSTTIAHSYYYYYYDLPLHPKLFRLNFLRTARVSCLVLVPLLLLFLGWVLFGCRLLLLLSSSYSSTSAATAAVLNVMGKFIFKPHKLFH